MTNIDQILKPKPKGGYLSLFKKKHAPINSIAVLCTLVISNSSYALLYDSPKTSIKKIIAYPNLEGGSVVIELERNGSLCDSGYFLSKNDAGFDITYKILIDSFRSDENSIMIQGHSLKSFTDSFNMKYCHIANVQYYR